ncbi:MAG: transglutaminase-like domain-containing protein [Bacillota bacterium]
MRRNTRRSLILVTAITVLFTLVSSLGPSTALALGGGIDVSTAAEGYVAVTHPGETYGRIKALVEKGTERYAYDVRPGEDPEALPLQMGNGVYTIRLMQNTTGNLYREINRSVVVLDVEDENTVYLSSIQNINWKASEKTIALAQEIVEGLESDKERILAVYDYIVRNFAYDHKKAKSVGTGYLPDLDEVIEAKKGICYDLASLMAGLLRSIGIPAKLITGYVGSQRGYHAWTAAFDGENWEQFDPTFGAARSRKTVVKPDETYEIRYQY